MNLTALSVAQTTKDTATSALTMADKGIISAKVVLTGIVVVFAMLLLLILIISVYGKIVSSFTNRAENKRKAKEAAKVEATPASPAKVSSPVVNTNGISDEVVAVISAAVASMYGSTDKVKIKSIKKSSASRSAWANAGVLNNTRPF